MTDRLHGACFSKLDDGYGHALDDLGSRGLEANIKPASTSVSSHTTQRADR